MIAETGLTFRRSREGHLLKMARNSTVSSSSISSVTDLSTYQNQSLPSACGIYGRTQTYTTQASASATPVSINRATVSLRPNPNPRPARTKKTEKNPKTTRVQLETRRSKRYGAGVRTPRSTRPKTTRSSCGYHRKPDGQVTS